ncbi:MAG: hypothetical protein ACKOUR_00240 [Planctomycetota bacterium]
MTRRRQRAWGALADALAILVGIMVAMSGYSATMAAERGPNFIVILMDDMGWRDV